MNIEHKTFEWLSVVFESGTNYVNLTKLARSYKDRYRKRRDVSQWINDKSGNYKERLRHYSKTTGIPENELVIVKRGGEADAQGTFAHYKLAISFAIWLSPEFEAFVIEIIEQKIKEIHTDEIAQQLDHIDRELNSLDAIDDEATQLAKRAHTDIHRSLSRKKDARQKRNSIRKRVKKVRELRKEKPKLRPNVKRISQEEE